MRISSILLMLSAGAVALTSAWVNSYDKKFTYQCPGNQALKTIESQHNNKKEDRQFDFTCTSLPSGTKISRCEWSGYTNSWDAAMAYECPGDRIIAGVHAYHNNDKEDRRYKFRCCEPDDLVTYSCEYTGYVNDWDGYFHYRVPDDRVITGVSSFHDNHREDRRFKFKTCRLGRLTDMLG